MRGRKGEYRKELAEWQKAGFTRVRIDGEFYAIEEAPALDKKYKHDIEVVVDRIVVREGIEARLADSFEQALKLAEGLAYLDPADARRTRPGSERTGVAAALERGPRAPGARHPRRPTAASPSPRNSPAPSPASPSPRSSRGCSRFNAPQGACPGCDGLGEKMEFDEDLVVPNHALQHPEGRGRALGQEPAALALLHAGAGQPGARL